MTLSREAAETVGLRAVAWLAGEDRLLPVFLGATGASGTDFHLSLQDPGFQGAVLDFILMDDAWVQAFCAAAGLSPDMPMRARASLPGGEQVHWT